MPPPPPLKYLYLVINCHPVYATICLNQHVQKLNNVRIPHTPKKFKPLVIIMRDRDTIIIITYWKCNHFLFLSIPHLQLPLHSQCLLGIPH